MHFPVVRRVSNAAHSALVLGRMVLDLHCRVQGSHAELASAIGNRTEKLSMDWHFEAPSVGGSVAHHARQLKAMGVTSFVSCIWPLPAPSPFLEWAEANDVDTRFVRVLVGEAAASLILNADDGHILLTRSGTTN